MSEEKLVHRITMRARPRERQFMRALSGLGGFNTLYIHNSLICVAMYHEKPYMRESWQLHVQPRTTPLYGFDIHLDVFTLVHEAFHEYSAIYVEQTGKPPSMGSFMYSVVRWWMELDQSERDRLIKQHIATVKALRWWYANPNKDDEVEDDDAD